MDSDAKRQHPHRWYEDSPTRPRRPADARRDKREVRPSLLKLCQSAPAGQLHRTGVMRWIGMGADIHRTDVNGFTVLMLLAQRGDLEVVRYLVGQGMRVNAADVRGFTALTWAAWYEHREVVHYLKSRGATINVPPVLYAAARTGRVPTMQLLQQVGARMRCAKPAAPQTPAVDTPSMDITTPDAPAPGAGASGMQARATASPEVPAMSLLCYAAYHGQREVVQFLLNDPSATSVKDRVRAMHTAIAAGHYRVASLLETGRDRPYLHALRHLQWMLGRRARQAGRRAGQGEQSQG